ncbi:MAG: RES family NAD+ phosphorylase [Thermoleophilaceae bacterium]
MAELPGFRLAAWDTPLRVHAHREAGRYHRAGSPPTQYIGLHPLAPWAEYMRHHGLRSRDEVDDRRIRTWAIRVTGPEPVEIAFDDAPDHGLDAYDLVSDDWGACQDLADRLRTDAAAPNVVVVPSAALPGARNVVIFDERVDIPYQWEPVDDVDLPACVVAEEGRPPAGLADLVRHRDDDHAELEAWRSGEPFDLADLRL